MNEKNSELGFHWFQLKLYNVPLVDKQIEKVQQLFTEIKNEILSGDIYSIQKMSALKSSIKKRIKEIDDFYNLNFMDERVRYLQTGRMKLMRLISQQPATKFQKNSIGLPWESTQKFTINTPKSNTKRNYHKSPNGRTPDKVSPRSNYQLTQHKNKNASVSNLTSKQSQKNQKSHLPIGSTNLTKTRPITTRKSQFIPPKPTNNIPLSSQRSSNKSKPLTGRTNIQSNENTKNSIKKLSDLIFTIKMTKQQYEDFIEIKEKMNNDYC